MNRESLVNQSQPTNTASYRKYVIAALLGTAAIVGVSKISNQVAEAPATAEAELVEAWDHTDSDGHHTDDYHHNPKRYRQCKKQCRRRSNDSDGWTDDERCERKCMRSTVKKHLTDDHPVDDHHTTGTHANYYVCKKKCRVPDQDGTGYTDDEACFADCTGGRHTDSEQSDCSDGFRGPHCHKVKLNKRLQCKKQCRKPDSDGVGWTDDERCERRCMRGNVEEEEATELIFGKVTKYFKCKKQCRVPDPDGTGYTDDDVCFAKCTGGRHTDSEDSNCSDGFRGPNCHRVTVKPSKMTTCRKQCRRRDSDGFGWTDDERCYARCIR
jgi:uncharacterized protein YdeI (BOF family)